MAPNKQIRTGTRRFIGVGSRIMNGSAARPITVDAYGMIAAGCCATVDVATQPRVAGAPAPTTRRGA
jgi:hypothetical protein